MEFLCKSVNKNGMFESIVDQYFFRAPVWGFLLGGNNKLMLFQFLLMARGSLQPAVKNILLMIGLWHNLRSHQEINAPLSGWQLGVP